MLRLIARLLPITALLLVVSACDDPDPTVIIPEQPPDIVEPFQGVIGLNGAITHPFTVTRSGTMTSQLLSLSPDSTLTVGLSIGTWNGSICQTVLHNDSARQGSVVVGANSAPGEFCARIYDASGILVQAQAYLIHVTHQ